MPTLVPPLLSNSVPQGRVSWLAQNHFSTGAKIGGCKTSPKHRYASSSCTERLLQVGVQGIHDRKTVVTRIGFQQASSNQHVDFRFA